MSRLVEVAIVGFCLSASACAAPQATVVYSLQDIDCSSCLNSVAHSVKEQTGVIAAKTDRSVVEIEVTYTIGETSPATLDGTVAEAGFSWLRGAGEGRWNPEITFEPDHDVKKISHAGEETDIKAHLAPGKVTIVDFYAPWCGPCRVMTHEIKRILMERSDVALRKINIVDWDRPVVAQYLKHVSKIPYLMVFAADWPETGKVVEIKGVDKEALRAIVEELAARGAPQGDSP